MSLEKDMQTLAAHDFGSMVVKPTPIHAMIGETIQLRVTRIHGKVHGAYVPADGILETCGYRDGETRDYETWLHIKPDTPNVVRKLNIVDSLEMVVTNGIADDNDDVGLTLDGATEIYEYITNLRTYVNSQEKPYLGSMRAQFAWDLMTEEGRKKHFMQMFDELRILADIKDGIVP